MNAEANDQIQASQNIVMLVVNDGNDVRAHKEAIALVEGGYSVSVIGRSGANLATERQMLDGVEIIVTPQIRNGADLRRMARSLKSLSLRERVRAYGLALLWDCAGLTFASVTVAPKILKGGTDTVIQSRKLEARKNAQPHILWRSRLKKFGERANYFKYARGPEFPDRNLRTLKWVVSAVAFRLFRPIVGVLEFANKIQTGGRSLTATVYWVGIHLLPGNVRKRLQAKVVDIANRRRAEVNFFLYYLESRDAVRAKNPSVVHAHDLYMLQAAVKTAKENGAKVIYDAHEFERFRSHQMTDEQRKVIVDQEEKYIAEVDGVITVSDTIAEEMAKLLNLSHVELIYNSPVTEGFYKPPFRNVRVPSGVGPSTPLALFVGKVYDIHRHDHRVDHLIQALAQTPTLHLALLSITTPASRAQINNWAEKFYVSDRVHILDPVPYKDLLSYIHAADLGIYSMPARCLNIEYSMPNKLFEYALAGVPLAVSNLTDARRFITELGCGEAYDSWSVRSTAQAMQNVYENRSRYTMDGERLEAAQKKYGWEAQGAKLRRLYDAVLAGEKPAYRGLDQLKYPARPEASAPRSMGAVIQAAE